MNRAGVQSREMQEKDRFETLKKHYLNFLNKNKEIYKDYIYLNDDLLNIVVGSYFDDIYRFKDYSNSSLADNHKQAGYTIKWISKIKPIQINQHAPTDKNILLVNSSFALFAGFTFLDKNVTNIISASYLDHLIYSTLYRNISGRQLASTMYVLECCAMGKKEI
jgi:hypothetical protein